MGNRRRRNRHPRRYCTIEFLECTHLNNNGYGIVMWKNKETRVHQLLPGEFARIHVWFEDTNYIEAKVVELKNESSDRKLPLDHPKMQLGLYTLAHLTDKAQDAFKQRRVEKAFGQVAEPILVGKREYYRNKVTLNRGGFMPPGRRRKFSIVPEVFDLMDIDFSKYPDNIDALVIRRLDTEISGTYEDDLKTTDTMLGKTFSVGLHSFYQVNKAMAEMAYAKIKSFIAPNSIVYDLFGGAATIGIVVSDVAKQVYSVEINNNSHLDAIENIKINKSKNVKAIHTDANKWVEKQDIKPDVIIIDPARAGISRESATIINDSGADTIIYLSCNIDTQVRDVNFLFNYKIELIQPYDFFPQTSHIENLVVLRRK